MANRSLKPGSSWDQKAACRDQYELFDDTFNSNDKRAAAAAKHLCRVACPVRQPCLELALSLGKSDEAREVMGGFTYSERQPMHSNRQAREAALAAAAITDALNAEAALNVKQAG